MTIGVEAVVSSLPTAIRSKSMSIERRRSILVITLDAPDPGVFKGGLYFNTIRQFAALGYDVHVASLKCFDKRQIASLAELGANAVVRSDYLNTRPNGIRTKSIRTAGKIIRRITGSKSVIEHWLSDARVVKRIGETIDPTCVVGLQSYQSGFAARSVAKKLGIPYICWEHLSGYRRGVKFNRGAQSMQRLFRESHVLVGVSTSVIEAIRTRFELDLPQAIVIPNPIPQNFAAPPQSTMPEWLASFGSGRFLFGAWTSWRNENKRLDLLIDAFRVAHSERPGIGLIIAGPIQETDPQLEIAKRDESILLAGNLARSEIHQLAHAVRCCCISSDHETFGLPMVEAMAAGRPVISTLCGGPNDVLDDPRLGRLTPVGDVQQYAQMMVEVYDQRAAFDRSAIAELAERRFGDAVQLERWRRVFSKLQSVDEPDLVRPAE